MAKIRLPKELTERTGVRGKNKTPSLQEVLPYIPHRTVFFDIRHLVYGEDILPFAVTTRIDANNQQFLKEMKSEPKDIEK